ncbi:MAG: CTP synthetase [Halobacteriales archaeon]
MRAVVAGPDRGIAAALEAEGFVVETVEGAVTGADLEAAGIGDAALFVLTDASEATSIPVARDHNPDLRIVVYDPDSMPEFVRGQVDLAVAPDVLDAEAVAEELAGTDA